MIIKISKQPFTKDLIAIVCLAALAALFFAPVVFTDRTFIARDNHIFTNPRQLFAAESIRAGEIPFWNPYLACGVPFQANLQNSLFYPLSILCYVLPFQAGFKYYIVLHYFLGALFMYLLMRVWSAPRYAAAVAGIVFAFGGYMASLNDYVPFVTAGIWLPCIMALYHCALAKKSFFYALLAGVAIGMQFLAGDASAYILSSGICMVVYTVFWISWMQNKTFRPAAYFFLSWIAGILLAAVQLLPFAEFILHSNRWGALNFLSATRESYHPLEFLQLFLPYLFGSLVPQLRWFGQGWLDTFYVGIFPLLFCFLFVFFSRHRLKLFLCAITLVSVFLSTGKHNPLFYFVNYIPGMGMLQHPVKFLFLGAFSLSAMAGWGLASFYRNLSGKRLSRMSKCLGGILALLLAAFIGVSVFYDDLFAYYKSFFSQAGYSLSLADNIYYELFRNFSCVIGMVALFLCLVLCHAKHWISKKALLYIFVACIMADLYWLGKPTDPYVPEKSISESTIIGSLLKQDTSVYRLYSLFSYQIHRSFLHVPNKPFEIVYRALKENMIANLNMYEHLSSAEEYGEVRCTAYYDLFMPVDTYFRKRLEQKARAPAQACLNILSLLNVKYIVSQFDLSDLPLELVFDDRIKVYRNPAVMPRVFFADRVIVGADEKEVLRSIQRADYDLRTVAYIAADDASNIIPEITTGSGGADGGSAVITRYEPNTVTIEAANAKPALLIVTDNFYSGWQAYDRDQPVPILRANHTFRGIPLAAGQHSIRLEFRPGIFYAGAGISLSAVLCICAGLWLCKRKKKAPGAGMNPPAPNSLTAVWFLL